MAKMKWTKPSAETVAYFERIAPGPPIQVRRMFGMPARFLNGHMLVAVFGNTFMLHLSEADREACIRAGAKPFAPMGREAREYVDIPPGTFDDRTLKEWIVRGMRYLGSLPPKLGAKRGRVKADGASRAAPVSTAATARGAVPRRASASATAPARSAGARRASASAPASTPSRAPRRAKSRAGTPAKALMNGSPAKSKKTKSVAKKTKKRRTR